MIYRGLPVPTCRRIWNSAKHRRPSSPPGSKHRLQGKKLCAQRPSRVSTCENLLKQMRTRSNGCSIRSVKIYRIRILMQLVIHNACLDSTPVSLGCFLVVGDVMCMTHQQNGNGWCDDRELYPRRLVELYRNRVHGNFKPRLLSKKGNNCTAATRECDSSILFNVYQQIFMPSSTPRKQLHNNENEGTLARVSHTEGPILHTLLTPPAYFIHTFSRSVSEGDYCWHLDWILGISKWNHCTTSQHLKKGHILRWMSRIDRMRAEFPF